MFNLFNVAKKEEDSDNTIEVEVTDEEIIEEDV